MLVSIARQRLHAAVQFAYDPDLVELIRSVSGRHWRADEKRWIIPAARINGCAALFHDAGCKVTVDGKVWTPPAQHRGTVPSSRVELLTSVSSRSLTGSPNQPTAPLIRVWHPDTRGDHQLAHDLNHSPRGSR